MREDFRRIIASDFKVTAEISTKSVTHTYAMSDTDLQRRLLRARELCLLGDYGVGLPEFRRALQDARHLSTARNAPLGLQQVPLRDGATFLVTLRLRSLSCSCSYLCSCCWSSSTNTRSWPSTTDNWAISQWLRATCSSRDNDGSSRKSRGGSSSRMTPTTRKQASGGCVWMRLRVHSLAVLRLIGVEYSSGRSQWLRPLAEGRLGIQYQHQLHDRHQPTARAPRAPHEHQRVRSSSCRRG